jgi:hypothetical protein
MRKEAHESEEASEEVVSGKQKVLKGERYPRK